MLISVVFVFHYSSIIIILFFAGLILNAVYFIAYITIISVFIFYFWTFWQYVETKYFTLKIQVYEVCKKTILPDCCGGDDSDDDNGNSNGSGSHVDNYDSNDSRIIQKWKYNRNNEPMISKQFYDRIREEILPYNVPLFNFFIKVLLLVFFALFMFTVINILRTADISGTVKVITTMSVSVVPHILNVVAAKISEERKNAQNEVQKIKVEKLVSKLTEDQVHHI